MTNRNKPEPKRHLGPAMQWAKRRSNLRKSDNGDNQSIEIDFADGTVDENHKSRARDAHSDSVDATSNTDSSSRNVGHTRSSSTAFEGQTRDGRPWRQSPPGVPAPDDTAWNYYSDTTNYGHQDSPRSSGSQSIYEYASTSGDSEPYDPYFREMSPAETIQHNSSSWDSSRTPTQDVNETNWLQFVFPVLVVAIIVFLAFITLIL